MQPLISIIVPVYNVEKYLYECLDSIVNQTYKNLEIILIDDGSPDKCGEICDAYAKTDKRISVIHKENGGVSSARNAGLVNAKGDFLFFIDGDDYIHNDCIESLYKSIIYDKSDCAISSLSVVIDGNILIKPVNKKNKRLVYSKTEAIKTMLYQDKTDAGVPGKLFKRKTFKNIWFPDAVIGEDLAVIYKVFNNCYNVSFLSDCKYNYLHHANAITKTCFHDKKLVLLKIAKDMLDYIKTNIPDCYEAAVCRYISSQFSILVSIPLYNKRYIIIYKEVKENIKNYRNIVIKDKNSRKKAKIACILSYIGFLTVRFIYRFYRNKI